MRYSEARVDPAIRREISNSSLEFGYYPDRES
jgi:hypothetical protein